MNLEAGKIVMVFCKEFDDKKLYSIGLSKKNKNGGYDNGFMSVRFKKGVEVGNKTRIKIKDAWLSFNTNEGKTFPFIFINDFEIISEANPSAEKCGKEENPYKDFGNSIKTEANFDQIEITSEDLPF